MNTKKQNNFTNSKGGDKMKADINPYPNLTDEQKSNINSAYNAKKSGIISEKQYSDNLKKNGINSGKGVCDTSKAEFVHNKKHINSKDFLQKIFTLT